MIHEDDNGEVSADISMGGAVNLLRIGAAALRHDDLTAAQELVADAHSFREQSAGIPAQIEHKTLKIAELIEGVVEFAAGSLLKLRDVDVADAGTNLILEIDRGMRNFIADQVES